MKRIYKIMPALMVVAMAGIYTACTKDDLPNNGEPIIEYVRVTDPLHSDSLLVQAFQGNLVAIIGENLQGVTEIWFNDQRATITPTYITDKTILVNVPSTVPSEVTNTLKLVFSNGKVLQHDFTVAIKKPDVASMDSEYVFEGQVATIRGDFFYAPLTVTFTGGVDGEVVEREDKVLTVKVPAGAEPGPISIKTNFGTGVSDFWFRDNRNIFGSSDDPTGGWWHGADLIVASDPTIDPINGNFIRVVHASGAYDYFEFMVGPETTDMGIGTKRIPDDAILNPEKYNLKFEVLTLKPFLIGSSFQMYIGNDMPNQRNTNNYQWLPIIDTKGQWATVIIPFKDFLKNIVVKPNPNGYGVSFIIGGNAVPMDSDFAMDNFRVVPIK